MTDLIASIIKGGFLLLGGACIWLGDLTSIWAVLVVGASIFVLVPE